MMDSSSCPSGVSVVAVASVSNAFWLSIRLCDVVAACCCCVDVMALVVVVPVVTGSAAKTGFTKLTKISRHASVFFFNASSPCYNLFKSLTITTLYNVLINGRFNFH